jgi:hypothetical protein
MTDNGKMTRLMDLESTTIIQGLFIKDIGLIICKAEGVNKFGQIKANTKDNINLEKSME